MAELANNAVVGARSATDTLSDKIMEPVEDLLDAAGLMQGELAPLKRTLVGAGLGYGVMSMWKPTWAYDDKGNPWPWRMTADKSIPKDQTTAAPYWLGIVVPAFVLGVLI